MMRETVAITPEQAEAAYQLCGEGWKTALENEEAAKEEERQLLKIYSALRMQLASSEKAFLAADSEALQSTMYLRDTAPDQRRVVETLKVDAVFMKRAAEFMSLYPLEDARIKTLEAAALSAAAQYEFEKSRSELHSAKLLGIISAAAQMNGGTLQIQDGGLAEGLRRLVGEMFDRMNSARRAAKDYRVEVSQRRDEFKKKEHQQ
jgi:hypothetical protein